MPMKILSLCTFSQFLRQQYRKLFQEALQLFMDLPFIQHGLLLESFNKQQQKEAHGFHEAHIRQLIHG